MTRDDSGDSAATDNSGRFNKGKWYDGDGDDNNLASAPMAITTTARTTVRTDDDRGLQLQNNTHNDEGYRVCVRIRAPCSIR